MANSISTRALVAVHTSSVVPSDPRTFVLNSTRLEPPKHIETDILPEHATEVSILEDARAHILLRVIHNRRTVELISLASNLAPIRLAFPAPLLPSPTLVFEDEEIHLFACTTAGSIFRVTLPLDSLWGAYIKINEWRDEYQIRQPSSNLAGPVHAQSGGFVFVGLKDGNILYIEANPSSASSEWRESVLKPPASLSLTSFLPFTTRPQSGASNTVAFASAPPTFPSLLTFSLQRDRIIRVWEAGNCVSTAHAPPVFHNSLVRGGSVPAPNRSVPILDAETQSQTLLLVIPPVSIPDAESPDPAEGTRLVVYMPSSAGGYFSIFVLSGKNVSGARALEFHGHRLASESSRARSLRDFLVTEEDGLLWVLWEDDGMTSVEYINIDFDADESEGEEEVEGQNSSSSWRSLAPQDLDTSASIGAPSSTSQNASFTGAFMSYLLRPGNFSKYTLRAALQEYVMAISSSPQASSSRSKRSTVHNDPALNQILSRLSTYETLGEQIVAAVGSTVTLNVDPQTGVAGEEQWTTYWAALRRDWEGFVARCRDIERRGRGPLKLGRSAYSDGAPLVIERERIGGVVKTDGAMVFFEREFVGAGPSRSKLRSRSRNGNGHTADSSPDEDHSIISISQFIRSSINPLQLSKVDSSLLSCARQTATSSFTDLAADISRREIVSGISEEVAEWLDAKIEDSFGVSNESGHVQEDTDLEVLMQNVFDVIIGLDSVKLEDEDNEREEEDVENHIIPRDAAIGYAFSRPLLEWQKGLTTAYLALTLQARYEITLAITTLLCYVADVHPQLLPSEGGATVLGEAFGALQAISTMWELSRKPAGDLEGKGRRVAPSVAVSADGGKDDVANLMRGMRVSSYSGPPAGPTSSDKPSFSPTYSVLHLLVSTSTLPIFQNHKTAMLPPSTLAHQYLAQSSAFFLGIRGRTLDLPEIPGVAEARLLHQLWINGLPVVVRDIAESGWVETTPGVAYVLGRALLDLGKVEKAKVLLEQVDSALGPRRSRREEILAAGLNNVLPLDVNIDAPTTYYRHLVSIFDKDLCAHEVIHFGRLAIQYSLDINDTRDLWFKIHKAHLDLGLYEEAYIVMTSTPFPDLQRELIRNLVNSMCDNHHIDRLVSLNFIGYQSDVEETLAFKARNADPTHSPHYGEVLHAWYVFRGDFRSAAAAMYQHGRRLADLTHQAAYDVFEVMRLQAKSYLAAINALSLLDQKNAWVQYTLSSADNSNRPHHHHQHIPEQHYQTASLDIDVVTLADIREEYALILARLDVLELGSSRNYPYSSEEIVMAFLQAGQMDKAMTISRSLKVDMSPIFSSLTGQCMRLASYNDDDVDPADVPWLLTDQVAGWEGSNIQRAWRLLRAALEKHDSLENDWKYGKVVFQRILGVDRFARVPDWLVKFFEIHQPEYLVRTSLKYGLVRDALLHALAMVRKANSVLLRGAPQQASATWLPYTLIDQVLLAASEEAKASPSSAKTLIALTQQLKDEITSRTKRLGKWKNETR